MTVWIGIAAFLLVMLAWICYENHRQAKEKKNNTNV